MNFVRRVFAFSAIVLVPLATLADLPKYQILDLGTPDELESEGVAINDAGQVTGNIWEPMGFPKGAFIASAGAPRVDLPTLGGPYSISRAINDAGQVTGSSFTGTGERAFVASADQPMVDLGTLGGWFSYGAAINNAGQVTGFTATADNDQRAFVADAGQPMADLGTLGGPESFGWAINDAGHVTGEANTADLSSHAFVASADQPMVDLGTLGGMYNGGSAINTSGQVAGSATTADGYVHAVIWTPISLLFSRLIEDVANVGPDRKLEKQLTLAQTYYDADDLEPLCSQLTYFSEEVQKRVPKKEGQEPHGPKITQDHADDLIGQSDAIMEAVGCP